MLPPSPLPSQANHWPRSYWTGTGSKGYSLPPRCWTRLGCLTLACGMVLASAVPMFPGTSPAAVAGEADSLESRLRYFEGLRERRLYELIELICQRMLDRPELSAEERSFYQIELATTYALHAQDVPLAEAGEFWIQAEQMLVSLPRSAASRDIELALLGATRARHEFLLTHADPGNTSLRQEFQKRASTALPLLQAAEAQAVAYLSATSAEADPRISEARLDELKLAQARLHLQLAELQAGNIPERTLHLKAAQDGLNPLARRTRRGSAEFESHVLQLWGARLGRVKPDVESLWKYLNQSAIPVEIRNQATAEYARFLLDQQQPTAAAELILQHGQEVGFLSAELEHLRLRGLLDMALQVRAKGDERLARELESEVQLRLSKLDERGEAYYARIVRNHQSTLQLQRELGPQVAPLVRDARQRIAEGNRSQARESYDQALRGALAQAKADVAMNVAREAARNAFELRDFTHAAEFLEQVWRMAPAFPGMEEIHLLWIQALGRDYLAARDVAKLARYQTALEDHLARYSGKPTRGEALWLLAELQFARLQVTRALELYQQVPADGPRGLSARLRQGQCYQWIIQRVRDLQQPVLTWEAQAREFALRTLRDMETAPLDSPAATELVVLACHLLLQQQALDTESLGRHLERVREASQAQLELLPPGQAPALAWKAPQQAALALQAISLAQRGRVREARELLTRPDVASRPPGETLFLLRQLTLPVQSSPEARVALAELCLQLADSHAEELKQAPERLNEQETREWLIIQAEAHYGAGRITPALQLYDQLQRRFPQDRALLNRLSALYDACGNADCAEKHYQLWLQQTQREKQGSEAWLEGRYQLARLARRTGRLDEARKIVQVTLLLYPQAGSEQTRQLWRELETELDNDKPN
ncbi:MAG: tetratricopeptide repeat protein [Planctomycetaceae bacterium]